MRALLSPVTFAFRTFNTVANVYLAGQIGWWGYKKVRELQKEKLRAGEIRERFIEEYKSRNNGKEPDPELVSIALNSAEAVDRPLVHKLKSLTGVK